MQVSRSACNRRASQKDGHPIILFPPNWEASFVFGKLCELPDECGTSEKQIDNHATMKRNAPYHQRERGGHAISLIPNSGALFPVKFKKPDLFAMLTFIRSTQNSAIAHLQIFTTSTREPTARGPLGLEN